MITLHETTNVMKGYISNVAPNITFCVIDGDFEIPKYIQGKSNNISICKLCLKKDELRKICRNFYKSIKPADGISTCPFGINIQHCRSENSPKPITIFLQTGIRVRHENTEKIIKNLPRLPKKLAKRAIATTSINTHDITQAAELLNKAESVMETLLNGRVAVSMRELTHQLLTPVQGAMNDLSQLNPENSEISNRLAHNISTINNLAKRIHILLSENVETIKPALRKVVVHDVINRICGDLKSIAQEKNLTLKNNYNKGYITVEAIPDQLEIAVACLIENAIKYSFSGFLDKKRYIEISYKDVGTDMVITINNLGCPITESEIEDRKLFELGYRGACSHDRGRQGTGSGLYIVERILKAHNAKISVSSKLVASSCESETTPALNNFEITWPWYFEDQ